MTLIELHDFLGNSLEELIKTQDDDVAHRKALENAEYIAKLSKQIINNADVVLRTDKMCGMASRINRMVGE